MVQRWWSSVFSFRLKALLISCLWNCVCNQRTVLFKKLVEIVLFVLKTLDSMMDQCVASIRRTLNYSLFITISTIHPQSSSYPNWRFRGLDWARPQFYFLFYLPASCLLLCRYTAVAMPLLYNTRYSSRRRVAVMIAVVWFLSFAISCPLLFGLNNTGRPPVLLLSPSILYLWDFAHSVLRHPSLHRWELEGGGSQRLRDAYKGKMKFL